MDDLHDTITSKPRSLKLTLGSSSKSNKTALDGRGQAPKWKKANSSSGNEAAGRDIPPLHNTTMVTINCSGRPWFPSRLASDGAEEDDMYRGHGKVGGQVVEENTIEVSAPDGSSTLPDGNGSSEEHQVSGAKTGIKESVFERSDIEQYMKRVYGTEYSKGFVHRSYPVHKSIACAYSPYFAAAFNGRFIEGETQTLLLHANPEVTSILVRWLYTQHLEAKDDGGKPIPIWHFLDLWLLADFLMMPELQNQAIIIYMRMHSVDMDTHPHWLLQWIWKSTTGEESALRAILVEEYSLVNSWDVMLMQGDVPKEMMALVWEALMMKLEKGGSWLEMRREDLWAELEEKDYLIGAMREKTKVRKVRKVTRWLGSQKMGSMVGLVGSDDENDGH